MSASRKWCRVAAGIAGMVILCGLAAPRLKADDIDKKVVMTFSGPVEIPGNRVLPAGTYAFRQIPGSEHVMMVTNEEGTRSFGMFFAQQDSWPTDPSHINVRLEERRSGAPPALKSWNYPPLESGFELMYPHK